MIDTNRIDCETVDEFAASYGLDAVEPAEDRAISAHLVACERPHAEARELIGVAGLVPAGFEPIAPSTALRDRLMATVASTPQEHRPIARAQPRLIVEAAAPRRPWWQFGPLPAALAAGALAAAVGLGAWGFTANSQLAEREDALRAIASADAIHAASGSAGTGWVIESDGQAMFMAEDLASLPQDRLYELWIIDADGNAIAAGVLTETDGVALVTLEHGLEGATAFAVTVETERVDQPTSDPVLVAPLDA
jgi:anti-sigma-K factor RskA